MHSLLAAMLLVLAGAAWGSRELPQPVQGAAPPLRALGEGEMRWFGLHLYDATLWVSGERWEPRRAFALDIRYARDISRERLVESSVSEMRRLGFGDEATLARWSAAMAGVFPEVRRGDRLVGVHLPGRGASFFSADRYLGTVPEDAFAEAFFAIWLDARTREPRLREALLGMR